MPFEFGDVVLVRFPFTHLAAAKQRPAVVLSSKAYNQARPDVILIAVTSQLRASAAIGEHWIAHWESAGLLKPSAIKPVIATIEQTLILRSLGRLDAVDLSGVRKVLAEIIA